MLGIRGVSAEAGMLGILAVTAAGPAAAAPVMSGHYIERVSTSGGNTATNDWYFTPCGDGCADWSLSAAGAPAAQARLINGQWTMDLTTSAACPDGTMVRSAQSSHYMWDPLTLLGTVQVTVTKASCGDPAGTVGVEAVQLTQAG
jgi:hypothetical protein